MEHLYGKPAADALQSIVELHTNIAALSFIEYSRPPQLQERTDSSEVAGVTMQAVELRSALGIPFWDAMMLSCLRRNAAPEPLLDAALFHRTLGTETWLTRAAILNGEIQSRCAKATSGQLAVTSRIRTNSGNELHLPLLDLHCTRSDDHLQIVQGVARRLLPGRAVILETDKSYHLYGLTQLESDGLIDFLATALMFAPIVDRAYIAHQLLERRCVLRLSANDDKQQIPTVVSILAPRDA